VKEILDSSLKGEWQAGDTLEVWTCKEGTYTNILPSVRLPLDARSGSKTRLLSVLQGQVNDRRVAYEQTMPELARLLQKSDFNTVIIVSAGDSELHGTPFDTQINEAYRQWQGEQRKLRLPFITILRAGQGKTAYWSVSPAQWPLELPPFRKGCGNCSRKIDQAGRSSRRIRAVNRPATTLRQRDQHSASKTPPKSS
jgi:hypothetical protein